MSLTNFDNVGITLNPVHSKDSARANNNINHSNFSSNN